MWILQNVHLRQVVQKIFKTNERKIHFLKSFYFHKAIHLENVFFHLYAINITYKFMLKI